MEQEPERESQWLGVEMDGEAVEAGDEVEGADGSEKR